jgi:hypothetical protein
MLTKYIVETIPDEDILFMRVHKQNIDFDLTPNDVKPVAFDPKPTEKDGLSTNWSRYSDAKLILKQTTDNGKDPNNYGVISLPVGNVRTIEILEVKHDPVENPDNQAHSLINNIPPRKPNDLGVRIKLREMYKWEIFCNK